MRTVCCCAMCELCAYLISSHSTVFAVSTSSKLNAKTAKQNNNCRESRISIEIIALIFVGIRTQATFTKCLRWKCERRESSVSHLFHNFISYTNYYKHTTVFSVQRGFTYHADRMPFATLSMHSVTNDNVTLSPSTFSLPRCSRFVIHFCFSLLLRNGVEHFVPCDVTITG